MIRFTLLLRDEVKYRTLITQELLKKGILAETAVYVCTEHAPAVLDHYFDVLDPVFDLITQCESGGSKDQPLEGPMCQSGFKRLN